MMNPWWGHGWWPILWLVPTGLVFWAVWASGRPSRRGDRENIEGALHRRFAAGEIDATAYRKALEAVRTVTDDGQHG